MFSRREQEDTRPIADRLRVDFGVDADVLNRCETDRTEVEDDDFDRRREPPNDRIWHQRIAVIASGACNWETVVNPVRV